MGEVYLVEHPRLPRQDALKVLAESYTANDEYRQRFQREAELAASLWHPHLVALHDRGEAEGRLWISMDFIDGSDTGQLLRSKYPAGMPTDDAIEIIAAVASALDYAHDRGMLHRDVKPSNILLSEQGPAQRRIALADFGIGREMDDVAGLTATNLTVGTMEYAAPEQLMGQPIDARADQYALAATAFHLLTGIAPFRGSNPVAVISQQLTTSPPDASSYRPELAPLNPVFARAMAKDPAQRYPSCADFVAEFKRLAGTIITTPQTATSLAVPAEEALRASAPTMAAPVPHSPPSSTTASPTRYRATPAARKAVPAVRAARPLAGALGALAVWLVIATVLLAALHEALLAILK